jgi:2-dehydro-3-deoxyphosphogluconate aldolase/(4S)-4-hydroxy-2-oxoglutarate aldolase
LSETQVTPPGRHPSRGWLPSGIRIVPVIVVSEPRQALPLAMALVRGGLPCAEITLRTTRALEAIELIALAMANGDLPEDFALGAGTVLNARQAADAVGAGARYLVSPGLDDGVWARGAEAGVPVVPGIATATELQRAHNWEARMVKFFPAATSGGIPALRALAAPFPSMTFMPTGGITQRDAPDWLALPAVVAVGGSWITPTNLLERSEYGAIEELARRAVGTVGAEVDDQEPA